jgi:hypothetical protein
MPQQKSAQTALFVRWRNGGLLDLGFLEFHVLAHHGIIFLHGKFFRLGARILLGHIEVTGVSSRRQLDLDNVTLGHNSLRME